MTDMDKRMADKMANCIKDFVIYTSCMKEEILRAVMNELRKELRVCGCVPYNDNENPSKERITMYEKDAVFLQASVDLVEYYQGRRRKKTNGILW